MGKVRTILGDVDSSELGIVDAHEHLIRTGGLEILKNGEDWRLDNVEKAIKEVKLFARSRRQDNRGYESDQCRS